MQQMWFNRGERLFLLKRSKGDAVGDVRVIHISAKRIYTQIHPSSHCQSKRHFEAEIPIGTRSEEAEVEFKSMEPCPGKNKRTCDANRAKITKMKHLLQECNPYCASYTHTELMGACFRA